MRRYRKLGDGSAVDEDLFGQRQKLVNKSSTVKSSRKVAAERRASNRELGENTTARTLKQCVLLHKPRRDLVSSSIQTQTGLCTLSQSLTSQESVTLSSHRGCHPL